MEPDTLKLLNSYKAAAAAQDPAEQPQDINIIDDESMIKGFVSRDERALSAVMEKYGKQCFVIAKRFLNNKEDSEQCVNDALMKA